MKNNLNMKARKKAHNTMYKKPMCPQADYKITMKALYK